MNSTVAQTLLLLDIARSGIPLADINAQDATLVPFGLEHGLIRIVPVGPSEKEMVMLTGTALESSITLRDAGNPIFGVDIQPSGLSLRHELTQEQWLLTLKRVRLVKTAYHNVLADLVLYGRQRFGEEYVDQSIEQLEFAFDDIHHANSIAHVPRLLRENFPLSSEHYYVLGLKFPTDQASQQLWAARAREHKLTPHLLKRSIEDGRILTEDSLHDSTGHGSGIPILQGITLPFQRWQRTVGGLESVKNWEPERRAAVLREIAPLVDFALQLRETLEPQEA